jgi:putative sigma-54 modulation protein
MGKKADVREKFAGYEYPIQVIGRHVDVTPAMKNYAIEKLGKIERFGGHVVDAVITMDIQKMLHTVDIVINVNNTIIKVSGWSESMYASIDQAIEHLKAKLRRYVRRLHEYNKKHLAEVDMAVNVVQRLSDIDDINDQIEEENLKTLEEQLRPHPVLSQEKRALKILSQEEAVMKMELSEEHFMVYRSEEDQKLKVIYKRDDGTYGIIEVER